MSRALDKDTLRALGGGEPTAAYEAISKALAQGQCKEHGQLLEIEILGKSHPLESGTFLLQDEHALAISKLGLVQAFFAARLMFQSHPSSKGAALSADRLLAITGVILLMDPEHLTAANARKRLIHHKELDSAARLELIRRDKFFVDSLLTSRLHRHTKSPTLWSHRRWLIETARSHGIQPDAVGDLKRIVATAGERHPRNYYAWSHARWLTGLVPKDQQSHVFQEMMDTAKVWCFRNHTDISGWAFLLFLLMKLDDRARCSVFKETLELAISFQWANESTWVFLRTLAASGAAGSIELGRFHNTAETFLGKLESPGGRRVLEQAEYWVETYRRRP